MLEVARVALPPSLGQKWARGHWCRSGVRAKRRRPMVTNLSAERRRCSMIGLSLPPHRLGSRESQASL